MPAVQILYRDATYTLTTEHAASSYGVPALVAADGTAYGPADAVLSAEIAATVSNDDYMAACFEPDGKPLTAADIVSRGQPIAVDRWAFRGADATRAFLSVRA